MPDLWDRLQRGATGRGIRAVVERQLERSLRTSLRVVYLRGQVPDGALVLAMNHHSFFDGHLVWLLGKLFGRPVSLLVAEDNLSGFPVLRLVGALEAGRLREALRRLQAGEWIAVFPEGELTFAGPLRALRPGTRWLAERARVPILPVACRVVLRGYEHPEAFLWLGDPLPAEANLEAELGAMLADLDGLLARTHPREAPNGYREVLRGRRSLEERVAPFVRLLRRR